MLGGSRKRVAWMRAALDRYEAPLTAYALRITGDVEIARDVVQDTFVKLCTAEQDRFEDHLAPWLYRVCRNRALDVMKKEQRMTHLAPEVAEAQPSPTPTPRVSAEGRETEAAVLQALTTLSSEQQEAFRLKFQHQLNYKEIGAVIGASRNHVRYLIHTALKALREELRDRREAPAES